MNIIHSFDQENWHDVNFNGQPNNAIELIEKGQVLFFPKLTFNLTEDEKKFLSPVIVNPHTKNISYIPSKNILRGAILEKDEHIFLQNMLARFAKHARKFIDSLLPHYSNKLEIGRTSYRPIQVCNRVSSYRKDDQRLHVDSFPSSPNYGKRLLRVFTNINPNNVARVWRLGDSFENVAKQFLPTVPKQLPGSARILKLCRVTKTLRSEYDHIMLHMHNHMKKDMQYQKDVEQIRFDFPANSTWVIFTDQVSHAAMSGQFLLEQTFYLPVSAMRNPERSPLKVLEKMTGRRLVLDVI